jgi:aldose 1-epimerase
MIPLSRKFNFRGGTMSFERKLFGKADGKDVWLCTVSNAAGMTMSAIDYGGIVTSFAAPDRTGKMDDIVLGYDNVDGYVKNNPFFGAIIGRYGNRIAKGRFTLGGREYSLPTNDGPNCLHGGTKGFDKVVWSSREAKKNGAAGVEFSYESKDGDQGFPGNLKVTVVYWLTDKREFTVDYTAATDKETVVNLTQHNYWNLSGEGSGDILGHELIINADRYTPADAVAIPTGELASVRGTPMDFTRAATVGSRIGADFEQLKLGKGYDHNWVINRSRAEELALAAVLFDPKSGRKMEVLTTEPGMQFYSGNFLDGSIIGKSGKPYNYRNGLCLETQHYPDSPNKPSFPTTVLKPGQTYRTTTTYRFSAQ